MSRLFYNANYYTLGQEIVNLTTINAFHESVRLQILNSMKMMAYLRNDKQAILDYLYIYMRQTWSKKTLENRRPIWGNEIPRIVSRRALTYKLPANRYIDGGEGVGQENYDKLHRGINKSMKNISRTAELMNTVLVRPILNDTQDKITYQVLTRANCAVDTDPEDETKATKIRYFKPWVNSKGEEEILIIVWTDSKHYATDLDGRKKKVPFIKEEVNPYNTLDVFVKLQLEPIDFDYWGDGKAQLVDGQEEINARLTDSHFKRDMSFGQPVGTNLDIKKEDYHIGPDNPILVDKADPNLLNPSLTFVTPDNKITEEQNIIDSERTQLSTEQGIPDNTQRYSSGYERELDSLELLELNQDREPVYREFEEDLYKAEQIVTSTESNINIGKEFAIEFAKIEFPKTEQEQIAEREWNLKNHLDNIVNIYMEETGVDDPEQAEKDIANNRAINRKYLTQSTNLNDLIPNNGQVTE